VIFFLRHFGGSVQQVLSGLPPFVIIEIKVDFSAAFVTFLKFVDDLLRVYINNSHAFA